MAKLKTSEIIAKLKEGLKAASIKKPEVHKPSQGSIRMRDMRQEARELGSHGAEEYFGKDQV